MKRGATYSIVSIEEEGWSVALSGGGVGYKSHPLVAIWPRKHNNDVNCSECESQTRAAVAPKQKQVLPEQYSWNTQCFNREKDGISDEQLLCAQKCLPNWFGKGWAEMRGFKRANAASGGQPRPPHILRRAAVLPVGVATGNAPTIWTPGFSRLGREIP